MANNDLQDILNNLKETTSSAMESELKTMGENMMKSARAKIRAMEREDNKLPRQYCHDIEHSVLSYPDKKTCEQAGHIWEDRRNAAEKLKEGYEAARDAAPNYLDDVSEKIKKKVSSITENSNARMHKATGTDYIDIPYGDFREACSNDNDFLEIPYDYDTNSLRFPDKIWKKDKSQGYTPDSNMFIGPTKVSLIRAVTAELPKPADKKDQIAVFTMGIKQVEKALYDDNGTIVDGLKITFYNLPGTSSSFPVNEYGKYIPLPLAEEKYDKEIIQLGRYADPASPGADFLTNFHQAWRYEIVNGMQVAGLNLSSRILDTITEEVFSREFFCCVFFEILAANPELKDYIGEDPGIDPSDISNIKIWDLNRKIKKVKDNNADWATDAESLAKITAYEEKIEYWENTEYSIQDFLDEQKIWLTKLKNILEILLTLLTHQTFQFGWPALSINILEILINSLYMVLMIVIDEVQEHVMTEINDWIAEKKEEAEAKMKEELENNGTCSDEQFVNKRTCEEAGNIWAPGSSVEAVLIQCLPWEQILLVLVDSVFGDEGLFDRLRGFVERMKASLLLKTKNAGLDGGNINAEDEANNKYIKAIKGAIDIIDWLLSLNADALSVCGMYSRNLSALGDETYKQATEEVLGGGGVSTGGRSIVSGENVPDGSSGFKEGYPSTGESDLNLRGRMYSEHASTTKIDITGNIVDPIGLLVYQTDEDIQKFFIQYMGLTPEEAQQAVTGSKKGECMKKLSDEESQQLKTILNNAGMEV